MTLLILLGLLIVPALWYWLVVQPKEERERQEAIRAKWRSQLK